MKEEIRKQLAATLFKDIKDVIDNLYCRWQDEKQYEDIKDYQKPLASFLTKAQATDVKMNKKPFGFTCKIGDAIYQYTRTSREYGYSRIA